MLKSIQGTYRNGRIELNQQPKDVRDETPVIVTFLERGSVDLEHYGIDETTAAELRARLMAFAEDWDSPEMSLYDDYESAKTVPMNEVNTALRHTLDL